MLRYVEDTARNACKSLGRLINDPDTYQLTEAELNDLAYIVIKLEEFLGED